MLSNRIYENNISVEDKNVDLSITTKEGYNITVWEVENFLNDKLIGYPKWEAMIEEALKRWRESLHINNYEEEMKQLYLLIERETGIRLRFLLEE